MERGSRDPYDPVEVLVNEWRLGRGPRGTSRWTASHPASAVVVATVLMLLIPTVPAFLAFRAASWTALGVIVVAAVGLAVVMVRANRRNVDITRRAVERFDADPHGSGDAAPVTRPRDGDATRPRDGDVTRRHEAG